MERQRVVQEIPPPDMSQPFDVVIVGGGPAGLTCALFLARARRRVLVFDTGKPRNYASHGIHGFLGQHGIKPAELLRRGRREALEAGVEICDAEVKACRRVDELFHVDSDCGTARGKRLVLAYGVRDKQPEIPGFERFYGRSIFHCPDCDGFEVSDKRVGVIGWKKRAVGLTLELRQWTRSLHVLTHGQPLDVEEPLRERLADEQIPVHQERITKLIGSGGRLRAVQFDDRARLELDAIFFTIGLERTCLLDSEIGCAESDLPPFLQVDARKETTAEGVYAIGDLVAGAQLAVTSAAYGAIAAIAINKSLLPPDWSV